MQQATTRHTHTIAQQTYKANITKHTHTHGASHVTGLLASLTCSVQNTHTHTRTRKHINNNTGVTIGLRQNGKEANNHTYKNNLYIMASLSCASILCAVVLLIANDSIRHTVEMMFA